MINLLAEKCDHNFTEVWSSILNCKKVNFVQASHDDDGDDDEEDDDDEDDDDDGDDNDDDDDTNGNLLSMNKLKISFILDENRVIIYSLYLRETLYHGTL